MKTILVVNLPAESGGALTILKLYYEQAVNDKSKNWIFITSTPKLLEVNHVKNISFPWVKKSWLHRLYFDYLIAPGLIKKYNVDEILSLQNVTIPRAKVSQTVYVHQSLPFADRRFSFKENKRLWVYQNLIGRMIIKSIRKSNKVIVQTEWMKKASAQKAGVNENKIFLHPPKININIGMKFQTTDDSLRTFFYPASGELYKNHELLLKAAMLLKESEISDYQLILTLNGDENRWIAEIQAKAKENNLPIHFVGVLTYAQTLELYSKSILVFPSYIETVGLPLLEAKMHETPILVSDMPYSREILDGYSTVKFFDFEDAKTLARFMEESIKQERINLLNTYNPEVNFNL